MPSGRVATARPVKSPAPIGRPPRRHLATHHHDDGKRRPGHRCHERNIVRRKEEPAVEGAGHQAQHDRNQAGPAPGRQPPDRQQRSEPDEADHEGRRVPDVEVAREAEGLRKRRERLEPGRVDRAAEIGESVAIAGERLLAEGVVGELLDRDAIVADRREADDEHRAQERGGHRSLDVDRTRRRNLLPRRCGLVRRSTSLRRPGSASALVNSGSIRARSILRVDAPAGDAGRLLDMQQAWRPMLEFDRSRLRHRL